MEGRIYKGVGGFYTVKTAEGGRVDCKPRGIFRKRGIRPLAGDFVRLASEAGTVYIDEIHARKNCFVRPPVANIDLLLVVASTADPSPSTLVIDKLTAVAVDQEVQPVLLVSKTDLLDPAPLLENYRTAGFPAFAVNSETHEGMGRLAGLIQGKLCVFCGNSGVGKSTLLNELLGEDKRATGEISKKLGRGRHTTREVEIFEVAGGLVADTPGFASFDLQSAAPIHSENMQFAFPEVAQRMPDCKFSGCAHLSETGCAVLAALERGEISQSRHHSYTTLYGQAKDAES